MWKVYIENFVIWFKGKNNLNAWTTLENITTLLSKSWILEGGKHRQIRMFVILWKKRKILTCSSIKNSQKRYVHPNILLRCQKVCVKRHQHQFTVVLNNWTFRNHHWDEFCVKNLGKDLTKSNWFRSWIQLTMQCVFASLSGTAIDLQRMPILANKIMFSDEAHFDFNFATSKIVAFGALKTRTHTLKSRRAQNKSLFVADFGPV